MPNRPFPRRGPRGVGSMMNNLLKAKGSNLAVFLELIASDGAFKTNPDPPPDEIQATDNLDLIEYVDSLDRVHRFPTGGLQIQYAIPMDQGNPSDAPDSEAAAVFIRSSMLNLNAAAGMNRDAFSIFFRVYPRNAGLGERPIFYMWNAQAPPKLIYVSTLEFYEVKYPVTPLTTHQLDNAPERKLSTVVMRYDGDAVYSDLYGEDGVTLLDSKQTLGVGSMTSASDVIGFGGTGPQTHMKRMAILEEFVSGSTLIGILEKFVTDEPLA